MTAQERFEHTITGNGTRPAYGSYRLSPFDGQFTLQPKPADVIGAFIYQSDQGYGYDIWGGQGFGDALRLVDGRGEWADLRTAPDYSPSRYDLKQNPQPTLTIMAFTGDMAGLWVNGELIGKTHATDASRAYKNPYDVNARPTKDTLVIGTLTRAFKANMIEQMGKDIKALVLDAGLELPTPQLMEVTQFVIR